MLAELPHARAPVSERVRSRRIAPILAVTLGLLAMGAGLVNVPPAIALHQTGPGGPVAYTLILLAVVLPGTAVGVLLSARRPHNPIGWLLLTLLLFTAEPANEYAIVDYRMHHGTLPLGWVAVTLLGSFPLVPVLVAILLWLFPDGHLPAGRWRSVARALIIGAVVLVAVTSMAPGLTDVARHDVHVDASGSLHPVSPAWMITGNLTAVAAVASLLGWLAVQVPRYRRSGDDRRQQLKWLYSGSATFIFAIVGGVVGPLAAGEAFGSDSQVVNDFIELAGSVLAVCIGIAVLKYRLYDIDRIISRTLAYAIVTGMLVGLYAGLVLLATQVLTLTSQVGVAAATLVAAALFNPLRRRVQRRVDRRFNRARYNADNTVTAFAARLQDTTEPDEVRSDLIATIHHALEPTHLSVWIPGRAS